MLQQIFRTILEMSITAGYCAVFVMIIRLFMKKLPRSYSYALWVVVFLRLLLPIVPESDWSLIPRVPEAAVNMEEQPAGAKTSQPESIPQTAAKLTTEHGANNVGVASGQSEKPGEVFTQVYGVQGEGFVQIGGVKAENEGLSASPQLTPVQQTKQTSGVKTLEMPDPIELASGIWAVAAVLVLTYGVVQNALFERKLKTARLLSDRVYEMEGLHTAFVTGLFRPRIYLPADLSEAYREYVLAHEEAHMKRGDNLIKHMAYFLTCLHWFNPLVWISFYLMCQDMEMSCDEQVLQKLGMAEKQSYSMALLSVASGRKLQLGMPLSFGQTNTKSRIRNVLKYRRPKFWVTLTAGTVMIVVATGLLCNPSERVVNAGADEGEYAADADGKEGIVSTGSDNMAVPDDDMTESSTGRAQNSAAGEEPTNVVSYSSDSADAKGKGTLEWKRMNPEEADGRKRITFGLACVAAEPYDVIKDVVDRYNQQSKDYYVEVVYLTEDWQEFEAQKTEVMNTLKSSNCTDILLTVGLEKEELAMAGTLADLKEFITEEEWNNTYVSNVLEATAIGGKLYAIGPGFSVLTIVADERQAGNDVGWTMEEMTEYLDCSELGVYALRSLPGDETVIKTIGSLSMSDFIDWETKTCDFENEEFYRILEFCKERETGTYTTNEEQDKFRADYSFMASVAQYQVYDEWYEGNLQVKGFPTTSGNGVGVIMYDALGIGSVSENKEAAWDFIQYYLREIYSVNSFSIFQERMNELFIQAATAEYASGWELPKTYYLDTYAYSATAEDIMEVKSMISAVDREFDYNDTYTKILEEEVIPYYKGEISEKETAVRIQERMNEYLEEFR